MNEQNNQAEKDTKNQVTMLKFFIYINNVKDMITTAFCKLAKHQDIFLQYYNATILI